MCREWGSDRGLGGGMDEVRDVEEMGIGKEGEDGRW